VSQRIAAHQSRRGLLADKPAMPARPRIAAGSRAAQAAARVAARYAQAPTYSQMQAAEVLARQMDEQPAFEAQAALPPDPQAASGGSPRWEPENAQSTTASLPIARNLGSTLVSAHPATSYSLPASLDDWESECSHTRWEADLAIGLPEPAPVHVPRLAKNLATMAAERRESPGLAEEMWRTEDLEPVEPVVPIHANLIEFPRELVATCRMRPRRVEGAFAAEGAQRQLSIFEVDPGALFSQSEAAGGAAASAWPEPEWSSIRLEAQPLEDPEPQDALTPQLTPQMAPIGARLAAALADGALIIAAFLGSALVAAANIGHPLPVKTEELGAAAALLLIGLLYQTLFLTLAKATPGMRCARISLSTFDGDSPTPAQLRSRLGALLLSVAPAGLGVAWILFDDDRLCWHDRLSRTYLRKR
jgi:uncharacterized RDD family membrane protein YckC